MIKISLSFTLNFKVSSFPILGAGLGEGGGGGGGGGTSCALETTAIKVTNRINNIF